MMLSPRTTISLAMPAVAILQTLMVNAAPIDDPWAASGCSMAPDTALMQCLGNYASMPPVAPTALAETEQAQYYCNIYQQLADCWAAGLYCKEWYPMQVAAEKLCILANSTAAASTSTVPAGLAALTSLIPLPTTTAIPTTSGVSEPVNTLSSVLAEASNVITSIWNNDSGTDIPVISNDLATETGSTTMVTWTHMSGSTPLPATDPLSGITSASAAPVITTAAQRRR